MSRPTIYNPSPGIDFIFFPYWKLGCTVFDDPLLGLRAEEFWEGADEIVDQWMRKLKTRRIALLSSRTAREGWTKFEHQGTTENGWQVYSSHLDGRWHTIKFCPNLVYYYPQAPQRLHFAARKASSISPGYTL